MNLWRTLVPAYSFIHWFVHLNLLICRACISSSDSCTQKQLTISNTFRLSVVEVPAIFTLLAAILVQKG